MRCRTEYDTISIATVSRVLNYDETLNVQDETRQRIFEAAEILEYKVKDKKKRRKKFKIGVLYSYSLEEELEDTYYLSVRVAIEKKIEKEGYKKFRVSSRDEKEHLAALDGLICLGTFSSSMVRRIESFQKPAVFVDTVPDIEKFDSVVHDIGRSVISVMQYLIEQGHQKIAFIGGYETDSDGNEVVDKHLCLPGLYAGTECSPGRVYENRRLYTKTRVPYDAGAVGVGGYPDGCICSE